MTTPIFLAPLIIASLALTIYALVDLRKRPDSGVMGGNRVLWVIVIVFGNTLGSIVYLTMGRQDPPINDD